MPCNYTIRAYTRKRAKQLGVTVKLSTNPKFKLDVFNKKGKLITRCGACNYDDFPTYIAKRGIKFAKTRRRLYKIRHEKDRHVKGSRGYYADKLLW